MIGQTISHYKILEKLGEGGMGVVYKAEDTKLKRTVALKFLPPELTRDPEAKERFNREAQAASALNHNNICTIHEIDEHEGQPFIAMEFLEGKSLKAKIESGPLQLDEAVDTAVQIAEGLRSAHKRNIIHRDVKSANVMITPDGQAKIMDFGLAKAPGRTQLTREGTTLGTVAYMSPEQGRGDVVDARSDVWSLGIVLYEMVTGELPFKADYEQATLYLILNEALPSVTRSRSDVSKDLERIIKKALAKEAKKRYESAEALKKDLESLMEVRKSRTTEREASAQESKPSIAVLPFRDMSSERDQDYFCEGIAEELINALVKLKGLRVAARTSAFQFKDRDSDIPRIGEQLKVKTVLEGSIRKAGNRLRITAQLINVEDGFHIWSEKYDRELDDIFAIQDEISLAIVGNLRVKLLGEEKSGLIKRHTVDQEAHNLYLKGLYFWNRRHEGGMKMAMECFRQAIDKDPGYALAHVGVADTYNLTGMFGYLPPKEAFPKGIAAARKALEIDDTLGEAHASLGFASTFYEWDWSAAENDFIRAIELSPNYATAHEWYGLLLTATGRHDEGINEAEKARDLDPLSLIINAIVGLLYYFARRYDESIASHKKALELDPNFLIANGWIVMAYAENGMCDRAVRIMNRVQAPAVEHPFTLGYFGHYYGACGQEEDALRVLDIMNELARKRYVSPMHQAHTLMGLGRIDEALDFVEKAFVERDPLLTWLKVGPFYGVYLPDLQYNELLKKIGL